MFVLSLLLAALIGLSAYLLCRMLKLSSNPSIVIGAIVGTTLFIGWRVFVHLYVEVLFYESIGYEDVFWLRLKYYWSIFGVSSLAFFILLLINSLIADWLIPVKLDRGYRWLIKGVLLVVALIFGWINAGAWDEYLLYINSQATEKFDPIYGRDLAFYFFELPIMQKGVMLILLTTFGLAISSALTYGFQYIMYEHMKKHVDYQAGLKGIDLTEKVAIRHAGFLAGLAIASLALWWWLKSLMVPINGATYMEVNYYYYAFLAAAVFSIILGVAAIIAGFRRSLKGLYWVAIAKAVFVVLFLLVGVFWQLVIVSPQELSYEAPYIQTNLDATKEAFMVSLDDMEVIEFDSTALDPDTIQSMPQSVIDSIRILDYEFVVLPTFDENDEDREYYDFLDTDMVMYQTQDGMKQVMSAPRELPGSEIPKKNFVTQRLTYVCSMGSVSVNVSATNPNGSLIYLTKELPMEGDPNLIPENEVFCYGESDDLGWGLTNTDVKAAGTPTNDGGFEELVYDGTGGIEIGSGMRRFILANYLGSIKVLTSGQIHPTSRVHIHRNIVDRLEKVLPAGWIDYDPYMVTADGFPDFMWIADIAMHNDMYPFSMSTTADLGGDLFDTSISYIRPSVKATVNAYTGDIDVFIMDEDPLAETWGRIFPDLFSSEPPEQSIAEFFRYPEEVFVLQMDHLEEIHVGNSSVYYNGSDVWSIWKERLGYDTAEVTAPRYVYTQLPGEKAPSYVLAWGFTRRDKEQAKAQLVGRIGEDGYELLLYVYQTSSSIGPVQFEGKIDKYSRRGLDLKGQITLAEQNNTLIRGNLIALPIGQSQLYIKPLYLRDSDIAQGGGLPALWKVIVGTTDNRLEIGVGDSLTEALEDFIDVNFEEPEPVEEETVSVEEEAVSVEDGQTDTCEDDKCLEEDVKDPTGYQSDLCTALWNQAQRAIEIEDAETVGRIALSLLAADCK